MHAKDPGIQCPTFLKQEPGINKLTESINQAEAVHEKAALALELQKEVHVLLECTDYKSDGVQCRKCHFLATVRKRVADVIILARKLA
ncbi:MAG: hypothetical protein WCH07_12100 [Deltaproteobacteria bacterium]